jgi:beta-glucosidase
MTTILARSAVLLALAAAGAGLLPAASRADEPAAFAPDPAIEARVADLLSKMTLEEKIGQMFMIGWKPDMDGREIAAGTVGAITSVPDAETLVKWQKVARASRLGIPLLVGRDVIHGYRTLFPMPLGLAATFDPALWRLSARLTAEESRSQGLTLAFAPMVDVSRDPRWGRVVEGPGEDPFLARGFADAWVRGLAEGGVAATLKHFVGYGAARAGRDYAEAEISRPTLADVHLPPFRAGVKAGAQAVMAAFDALDGVPGTINGRMIRGVLERDWGFDGFVISDWDAIRELLNHGVAATRADAAERAVNAGVDMEIAGRFYKDELPGLLRAGRVSQARIDDAVARILRVKIRLGLFDRPDPDPSTAAAALARPETRAAALEIARRSIVLLKNERATLPLVRPPKRIAVIGEIAVDAADHMGSWGALALQSDTVLLADELRRRLAPRGIRVVQHDACDDDCLETDGIDEAVAVARRSDLVVAVLGEPWHMTAEAASRTRIGLPYHEQALLDRLAATGKPVVLVVFAGRPMALTEALPKARAVVFAFSPGTMGGAALADVLLGEANPSGRLPMTMPRSVGQIPITYDELRTGRPGPLEDGDVLWSRYTDEDNAPLFPFGFGLSYTSFAYADLRLAETTLAPDGRLRAEVAVTNTGRRAGREIVQLYVRQTVASRTLPVRRLKGLATVDLAPGETKRVTIEAPVADLGFTDDDGVYRVEPAPYEAFVGGASTAELAARFAVGAK